MIYFKYIRVLLILILSIILLANVNQNITFVLNTDNDVFTKELSTKIKNTDSFLIAYVNKNNVLYYKNNSDINKVYNVASITKTFTALTILMLHEEKKLNIDDYVVKYSMYHDRSVTIRHLLSHSYLKPYGKKSKYNHLNYVVLKNIIEKVTGDKYHKEIEHRFFIPLNMYNSTALDSYGSGRIQSTLKDITNYTLMLMNNGKFNDIQVISSKTYELMLETALEREDFYWYWNLGGFETFTNKDKEITSFYKSGRWHHTVSGIEIFPKNKKAIIYLCTMKQNCLNPKVVDWRDKFWRFLRSKILV